MCCIKTLSEVEETRARVESVEATLARWRAAYNARQRQATRLRRLANPERRRENDRRHQEASSARRTEHRRERYRSDPEFRARILEYQRTRQRKKREEERDVVPEDEGVPLV